MKNYQKLCQEIKLFQFRIVLVSGAQRSGTRFVAKTIAKEIGYGYVDEIHYGIEDENRFLQACDAGNNVVIHCPAMSHLLHEIGCQPFVGAVFCHRDFDDIIKSQLRINWRSEPDEKRKYGKLVTQQALQRDPICQIKSEVWCDLQKKIIPHAYDSHYDWWENHPDFLSKEKRQNFHPSQTK